MQHKFTAIKPGTGIGELKFGLTRSEVESLLGKPCEIEKYSHSSFHEEPTEAWHYDDHELSLGFDETDNWRLVNIATTAADCKLMGKQLFGLGQLALMRVLDGLGIEDLELENLEEGQQVLTSDSAAINFWLEDGALSEIQIGPFYINDDTVKWPDRES